MTEQNTFMETVKNVAEIVRTAPEPMAEEEILSYFADMDLDENQKRLVMEYLMNPENHGGANSEEEADISEGDSEEGNFGEENELSENTLGEDDGTNSMVFGMYLDELATLPKYSNEQLAKMYIKLLEGDESVIGDLSNAWLERVLKIAEKYIAPKLNVEDLVQEGNIALLLKLQELAGNGNADVEMELETAVEQGIMTYASEMNSERELENTVLGKVSLIHEAKKMLQVEKGHEPTLAELSDYTKMTIEELEELEDVVKATSGK